MGEFDEHVFVRARLDGCGRDRLRPSDRWLMWLA
jgi:hypothetical protein